MYYHYNELKNFLVIKEENKNLFRQQTETEKLSLKEGLLFHKKLLSPLVVCENILGLVLVDGHHRWQLLSEVIKECPEFDLNIPLVKIEPSEAIAEMMRTQLGRRNLSRGEIAQYVDYLVIEKDLTKTEAIKQTAEDLDLSVNKVKNSVYPSRKEHAAQYSKNYSKSEEPKLDESLPISAQYPPKLDTPPLSVSPNIPNNSISVFQLGTPKLSAPSTAALSSQMEAGESDNTRDRTPEELQEIEDRYSSSLNAKGEEVIKFAPLASNELERLNNLKESTITEIKDDLELYKGTAIFLELKVLINSLDKRIKELS